MSGITQAFYNIRGTATVPTAPTIGTATATGSTTATVTYTASSSNGGSTITSYTAISTPGSITGTLATSGSGTITVTGLSPSTSYTFKVYATNAIGNSPQSAASNSISLATVPTAPTIGGATVIGPGTVEVTYAASSSNGGSTITSYTAVSSPSGITSTVYTSDGGTITFTGLSNGTAYTFTVYATNAIGNSPSSASSNSATPNLSGSRIYETSGAYTWIVPRCVSSISVLIIGGGGQGGGSTYYTCCCGYYYVQGGGGGGGGGLVYKNSVCVTAGCSYTLYVNNNANGGRTYFGPTTTYPAPPCCTYLYATSGFAGFTGCGGGGGGGNFGGSSGYSGSGRGAGSGAGAGGTG